MISKMVVCCLNLRFLPERIAGINELLEVGMYYNLISSKACNMSINRSGVSAIARAVF